MRSLSDKRKRWDSWEGNGVEAGKGMNRRAEHRCIMQKTKENFQKGACSTLGEDEKGERRVVVGPWVSFGSPSVSLGVPPQSWRFWLQSLALWLFLWGSLSGYWCDFAGKLRKKQMPGMTISCLPTCPLMDHNLAVVKGLVELKGNYEPGRAGPPKMFRS